MFSLGSRLYFLLSCRSSANTFDLENVIFCQDKSIKMPATEQTNLTECSHVVWLKCTVLPWFPFFVTTAATAVLPVLSPEWSHRDSALDSSDCKEVEGEGGMADCGKTLQRLNAKESLCDLSHRHSHFLPTTFTSCWAPCRKWRKTQKKSQLLRLAHRCETATLQLRRWKNNQKKSHELQPFWMC